MSAERVISIARGELGVTEFPAGSNRTKYGAAYGLDGYSWCVMFLWWCFREAGESMAFFGGAKTASCGQLLRFYQGLGRWVKAGYQPGDIVILNFSGTQDTEHCGLVTETHPDGSVTTVEGNTTPGLEGSQDNGGSVAMKRRQARNIIGVCRPQYKPDAPSDYAGHWAEEAIDFCVSRGLMRGYTDGTFRPEQAVTRGELAEVLRRLIQEENK